MTKRFRRMATLFLMVLMLAVGGCAGKLPSSPLDAAKLTVFERMVNSVVVLPGCTGIVLRNDGKNSVILTAGHCVRRFQTKLPDGKEITLPIPVSTELDKEVTCLGQVGSVSHARDLAIVTVENCGLPTTVAVLAKSAPRLGEIVYAVGHPSTSNYVLTKGIVSRPSTTFDDTKYMLVSAPVIFGNSGGPCLNGRGEVVGVVTNIGATRVRMDNGQAFPLWFGITHLGLAVPLDEVKQFLRVGGFPDLAR